MTARPRLHGGALAAALYAAEHGIAPAESARLHGVSRQAVSAAARDPGRFGRTRPPGRKPRGGEPARHSRRLRLDGYAVTLALTDAELAELELAAWEAPVGAGDLSSWARVVVGSRKLGPAAVRELLLAKARRTAGLDGT